jgi:protease-4
MSVRTWGITILAIVILTAGGCRTVSTDSRITVTGPLTAQVTADMQPALKREPLIEMTVQGHERRGGPKIALLDVDGVLANSNMNGPYSAGENPVDVFREKLDAAAADPCVGAVVVRINSPGGGVAATDVMWRELQKFRQRTGKPVVACLMDVGTGGAYYLATASDAIYAQPTTVTGAIGVILNLYNMQDAMAQFNVLTQSVKAGANIDMGSSTRQISDEQREWFQAMADEYHQRFKQVVLQTRPGVEAEKAGVFDGRVFSAEQARSLGLIDRVGYLDDAILDAQQRAQLRDARVVMFHRPSDPARTPYAITPNIPPQGKWLTLSIPGIERNRLPAFMYIWLPDPTLERVGGQ